MRSIANHGYEATQVLIGINMVAFLASGRAR